MTTLAAVEWPIARFLHRLVVAGEVDRIDLDDEISVRNLVVLDPQILHLAPGATGGWRPSAIRLATPAAADLPVDRSLVERAATGMFGTPGQWVPADRPLP